MSEADAETLGIKDNDWVRGLQRPRRVLHARASVSARIPKGVCIVYHVPSAPWAFPSRRCAATNARGGHNSFTRIHLKPNYLSRAATDSSRTTSTTGARSLPIRDTHVVVKRMDKVVF